MDHVGCSIQCRCGGIVIRLLEDEAYYWLTERHTIIFRGYCNMCNEVVSGERDILGLMLLCPSKAGDKWH